jgi:septation ring formation regulator EzrA
MLHYRNGEETMLDTDIEGLNPKDAVKYVLAFITTLKKTKADIVKLDEDIALWKRRVSLAQDKGETGLASQAQARVGELETKRATLQGEADDLTMKVSILKEKLLRMRKQVPRSVDVDLLLAQLKMVVGEKDDLSLKFKDEEANVKLEELKRKMSGGGGPAGGSGSGTGGPQ